MFLLCLAPGYVCLCSCFAPAAAVFVVVVVVVIIIIIIFFRYVFLCSDVHSLIFFSPISSLVV